MTLWTLILRVCLGNAHYKRKRTDT